MYSQHHNQTLLVKDVISLINKWCYSYLFWLLCNKLSKTLWLKTTTNHYLTVSQVSGAWPSWVLCSGFHHTCLQGVGWCWGFIWDWGWPSKMFHSISRLNHLGSRTEVLVFLLCLRLGCFVLLRTIHLPWHMVPHLQSQKWRLFLCWTPIMLQISMISLTSNLKSHPFDQIKRSEILILYAKSLRPYNLM
jgi:hypothetical protein